jgi:hypothetical protein
VKLSKKSGLILIVGIAACIYGGLWMARSQQVDEQERLHEELTTAAVALDNLPVDEVSSQRAELEERLSQAISQLETAKATLSQSTGSIDVSGHLFEIAEDVGVEVTVVSSSHTAGGSLGGIDCSVLPLAVTVEGDVADIISYVGRLNYDFPTGTIKLVKMDIPETTCEEEVPSATIQLQIYTYQGE